MQCNHKEEKSVLPFEQTKKGKDIIKEISALGKKYNIHEIIPLSTKDISVAHWVRLKCKYGCKNYATSWCCPPETPTPDQTKALLNEYQKALLLCGSVRNSHFYRDNHGYYRAFSLVSENCALCKVCPYPDDCIFPVDRRPSVESCSIDIFQTLKNIGKQFRIAHDVTEEYHCYSIILLE
jgi:predicted metal-binding protein